MTARPRVVIAGFGDTGVLVGIHLSRFADVVGISSKPGLVSGQELGLRLTRPEVWRRDYWVGFDRYRRLDAARTLHATVAGIDPSRRCLQIVDADGVEREQPYDVLVISTGVTNGFWRTPELQTSSVVEQQLNEAYDRIASAPTVAVIGGGAAAVSCAWNIAHTWLDKRVDLYFPGEAALRHHHRRVWASLERRLRARGVGIHPGHRAALGEDFTASQVSTEPVEWATGQQSATADVVLWTIGRVTPNTGWLPAEALDDHGFVVTDEFLRVPGIPGAYAIGDVAATDPLRSSARARADRLLAHNIRADLGRGRPRRFTPLRWRWGSVLGTQHDRLEVFGPSGRSMTIPNWSALQPWIVGRGIYGGIRRRRPLLRRH
ncbi:pyridine nucleotide-disulfide oxidoreductase [Nocardioides baekrokdamisoli]|uniref:Pyridine nucleotide-disulfide oxidoreductase n=1 Tax=Nocardioides baekrokdamisoli TaxID=1804624 RepID=A0A3G9IHY8_9ACTN|nr:FAD-dependent oxidoreductase [Nocardioides baekrokdamisoli]BBH18610.1 pyridine nucleotide-disulfide oxidoreductase [Nocardioides baekrokdamisoli]